MTYLLLQGDARHIPLADESVNCVVTSPPYWGLRDYGVSGQLGLEPTPDEYVAHMVEVFREVRRVLRKDGTCWLNLGDSYAGSGKGPTGHNGIGNQTQRQGFDSPKAVIPPGLKPKDLVGIPWMVAFALRADGWWLRSDIIWHKNNPMPESVTDRPTKAHEYVFLLTKSARYFWDAKAVAEPAESGRWPGIGPQHGKERDRNEKYEPMDAHPTRNCRSVWTIATSPYKGAHFATMAPKLAERCILAGCPVGGIVFDPFVGSGTTVAVAVKLGRRGIGLDLSDTYLHENAEPRVAATAPMLIPA